MRCQVVRHSAHPIDLNLYMLLQHPSLWLSGTARWNQNLPCSPRVPTSDFSPPLSAHSLLPLVLQECSALITNLLYTLANRAGDTVSTPTAVFPASLHSWHTDACTRVTLRFSMRLWSLFSDASYPCSLLTNGRGPPLRSNGQNILDGVDSDLPWKDADCVKNFVRERKTQQSQRMCN